MGSVVSLFGACVMTVVEVVFFIPATLFYWALCCVGFTKQGVRSHSVASWWQSWLPYVPGNSLFAWFQSTAAKKGY